MTKQKKLYSVNYNGTDIDMNINDESFNHFKSLQPLQQKAVLNLMTLKLLQIINE